MRGWTRKCAAAALLVAGGGPGCTRLSGGDPSGRDAAGGADLAAVRGEDLSASLADLGPAGPWSRDWSSHPAVYTKSGAARVWGLSDVHADRDRLVTLLAGATLVAGSAAAPVWTGGTDILVVCGDSIDKGTQSIEVLDYWMSLVPQAEAAGGEVVVLVGNHEVEFLADPLNSKAAALDSEITGESPLMFASVDDPHGRFLHERPIAALVDGWFFSHAGNSGGMSANSIGAKYRALVDQGI